MFDITRLNFNEYIDKVKSDITTASFISIDTEFSGLCVEDGHKESMLDSPSQRYERQRFLARKVCLFQCGITIFKENADSSTYNVKTYNFNLFPSYVPELKKNEAFSCQTSSIEFLSGNDFDFNKCFKYGINYLNKEDEMNMSRILSEGYINQQIISNVNNWLSKDDNADFTLDVPNDKSAFIMLLYLQRQFPHVKISLQTPSKIKFGKKTATEEDASSKIVYKHTLLEEVIGFSCIFKHMIESKRPLIGHNCFLDLLFLFEKLYMPLPAKYSLYKAQLREMFPILIDTKYVYRQLSLQLDEFNDFPGSLFSLYNKVTSEEFAKQVKGLPVLNVDEKFSQYISQNRCHEAGFDSYMCGVVLLYLAHFLSARAEPSNEVLHYTFYYYLQTLEPFTNKINLIRASTPYTDLSAFDPKPLSPRWLFARSKSSDLEYEEISSFLSPFSDFEIFRRNSCEALIALPCHKSVIAKVLKKSHSYKDRINFTLEPYSVFRHSLSCNRTLVLGGATVIAITAFILYKNRKN